MDYFWQYPSAEISDMIGEVMASVSVSEDKETVTFTTASGEAFVMYHSQSCCESVRVEDVVGDLDDLVGSPILQAEEVCNHGSCEYDWSGDGGYAFTGWPAGIPEPEDARDSFTWTFYKLATIKGSVTIRWLGESNGYYSEAVDMARIPAQ